MKSVPLSLALGTLAMISAMAATASGALSPFPPKVLPVLVQVNALGKITGVSPAVQLPPRLDRLLRANLEEMITGAAIDKRGRPISSQFVMNLALQTSSRTGGDYDLKFAYVSTSPVPPGSWYWVHTDGRQLALASQSSRHRSERIPYQHDQQRSRHGAVSPRVASGSPGTPAPVAAPTAPQAPARPSGNDL